MKKIEKIVNEYIENSYHRPFNEIDLLEVATLISENFIKELENNKETVIANYGLMSVYNIDKLKDFLNDSIKGSETSDSTDKV